MEESNLSRESGSRVKTSEHNNSPSLKLVSETVNGMNIYLRLLDFTASYK